MSRVETLELLGSVIDSVESINEVERGTPLKADDWNTMVGAVMTLAKLVASRERTTDAMLDERYAALSHTHNGQASLGWFEPHAQQLIEKSINGNVEQRNDIRDLQNRTKSIQKDIKDIKSQITDLRIAVEGLRDSDSIRENSVNRIGLRIEGLSMVDKQMADLNTRFDLINENVDKSLEFKKQLTDDNGDLINIAAIKDNVDSLNGLQEHLKLHDGNLVQIKEIESAIARLEENAINRNDVDDVIMQRLRDGDIIDNEEIVSTVTTEVDAKYSERFNAIDTKTAELESSMGALDEGIKGNSSALTDINSKVNTNSASLQAVTQLTSDLTSVKQKVTQLDSQVALNKETLTKLPAMDSRLEAVEGKTNLIDTLDAKMSGIDTRLKGVEEKVTAIDGMKVQMSAMDERMTSFDNIVPTLISVGQKIDFMGHQVTENTERISLNESELQQVSTIRDRVGVLENSAEQTNAWRNATDKKISELSGNSLDASLVNSRLSFLETRTAETSNNVKEIETMVEKNTKSTLLISRNIGMNL
jgi:predicted  nucleic acid-binding Zn-ribbon protein